MTADPSIVAAYRRAFARLGVATPVLITRITGRAPNAVPLSFQVTAVVRDMLPDTTAVAQTGYSPSKIGAITQTDRTIIVLASDLAAAGFPLPLKKHDHVTLLDPVTLQPTAEVLDITDVDAGKRAAANAIELKAAGVA